MSPDVSTMTPLVCSECDARVSWAYTDKGRRVLLDVEPDPQGSFAQIAHYQGRVIVARVHVFARDEARYSLHSCRGRREASPAL